MLIKCTPPVNELWKWRPAIQWPSRDRPRSKAVPLLWTWWLVTSVMNRRRHRSEIELSESEVADSRGRRRHMPRTHTSRACFVLCQGLLLRLNVLLVRRRGGVGLRRRWCRAHVPPPVCRARRGAVTSPTDRVCAAPMGAAASVRIRSASRATPIGIHIVRVRRERPRHEGLRRAGRQEE